MIGTRVAPGLLLLALVCGLTGIQPAASRAQATDALPEAAAPPSPAAADPPAPDLAPPPPRLPGPLVDRIEQAWNASPATLDARVARTRAAADESGIASLDAYGRALVFGGDDLGGAASRAEAAVILAPDLPAAHAAAARARLASGAVPGAIAAAIESVRALARSFHAALWLAATASVLTALALAGGSLAYLFARGALSAPDAAHDLGDRIEASMPGFSRAALLLALALLPAALGEGLAGAALAVLVLALWHASRGHQIALLLAASLFVAAIHPVANYAGAQIAAIGADPVVDAVVAAESGAIDPVDAARLTRAAPAAPTADPLALYALAQWTRRAGDLTGADARFAALLEEQGSDPVVLASAASAKLALGDPKAAVDLYRRAIELDDSALLWFDLSQAHGRAIDVDQHDRALAAAQSLDPDGVSAWTARLARSRGGFVADLPLPIARLRARLAVGDAQAAADQLRAPIAPGMIGRSVWIAALAFAAAGGLGIALQRRSDPSVRCLDCGTRMCRRCGSARGASPGGEPRCDACLRRRLEVRAGGAWEARHRGLGALAARAGAALAWLLPGLAGRSARRPGLGLAAALAAAAALAFALGAGAVVPDPATVGGAGAIAFGAAGACAATVYAALALFARRA